jgi:hypothetical protein
MTLVAGNPALPFLVSSVVLSAAAWLHWSERLLTGNFRAKRERPDVAGQRPSSPKASGFDRRRSQYDPLRT